MGRLLLLRHGQSVYNQKKIFTGWTDVELSERGRREARRAGEILRREALLPDRCFTSWLKRAIHTAQIALATMEWEQIDCLKDWRLNERHYGAWQGRNKDEVKAEVGDERFLAVRRGYDTPPPPLSDDDPRLPEHDPKYRRLDPELLPRSESLADTRRRVLPCFYERIVPCLVRGETVLVSAHGNSLRALVMAIEDLGPEEILHREIPTGEPLLYDFDETMKLIERRKLTPDP